MKRFVAYVVFVTFSAFSRSIVFSPTFVSVSEHNNSNGKGLIFMNIRETGRQWTKEKLDFWKVKVNVGCGESSSLLMQKVTFSVIIVISRFSRQ